MKKIAILLSTAFLMQFTAQAQDHKIPAPNTVESKIGDRKVQPVEAPVAAPAGQTQTQTNMNPDLSMKFTKEEHNFGTVPEGPSVTTDFEFTNIGKEPIVLSEVHASCGCTTPSWTKDPVMPGKTGKVSATYNTQGRPGPIMKTITITSNVGTKVVKITGNVEKAPESSVPANDNSMMKH